MYHYAAVLHYQFSIINYQLTLFCSFLFVQKRTKKGHPKTKTARFRGGGLIYLLYYCGLCIANTIVRFCFIIKKICYCSSLSIIHYQLSIISSLFFFFCEKKNQKTHPKTKTARFRGGGLI